MLYIKTVDAKVYLLKHKNKIKMILNKYLFYSITN